MKLNQAIILSKRKKNKRSFTLIEVFICLALIALCGSVFSIQGKKLWQRYHCSQDTDRLIDELVLTRHLSQTLRADIELHIIPQRSGITIERLSDEPYITKKSASLLKPIHLKHIKISESVIVYFYKERWESKTEKIQLKGSDPVWILLSQSEFATKKYAN